MRLLAFLLLLGSLCGGGTAALADADSPWTPGPGALGDDTYTGSVDVPADGATIMVGSAIQLGGWAVDRTAAGWAGVDDLNVYLGQPDQGGTLVARGQVGLPRPDVAAALGYPFFGASGFSAMIPANALPVGPAVLSVWIHTPSKGWWIRQTHLIVQVQVQVQVQAQAPLQTSVFSNDPLINVAAPLVSQIIPISAQNFTISGFAIDRNAPGMGIGGSGVNHVQIYLDGPLGEGQFLGEAQLGVKDRDATGYGAAFATSGWQITIHPLELTIDAHALFVYAQSATSGARTLTIVPFQIR